MQLLILIIRRLTAEQLPKIDIVCFENAPHFQNTQILFLEQAKPA